MSTAEERPDQPHIVYFHSDGIGRNLGCYGRGVETPNVDALAAEGVQFDSCFATAPYCSPSRSSVMTGLYPHRHGVMGHAHLGWAVDQDVQTLPAYLRDSGYDAYLFGKQSTAPSGTHLGYDEVLESSNKTPHVVDRFENRLDIFDGDTPVFASVGLQEPHRPRRREYIPDEVYDRYDPATVSVPEFLPDTEAVREDLAEYYSVVSGVIDPAFGRVRDALEEAGVADETLLVFTTDHGMSAPGAKGHPTDAGLETALIMSHPDMKSGARHEELLSNVDVFPTLLEAAGEPAPGNIDGRSFYPLLSGDAYEPRDRIFAEKTFAGGRLDPFRAIRTSRFKYVQNYASRIRKPTSADTPFPKEECYDLTTDPHEEVNVAADGDASENSSAAEPGHGYIDDVGALRSQLHEWMAATRDPLVDGTIPMPTQERKRLRR